MWDTDKINALSMPCKKIVKCLILGSANYFHIINANTLHELSGDLNCDHLLNIGQDNVRGFGRNYHESYVVISKVTIALNHD